MVLQLSLLECGFLGDAHLDHDFVFLVVGDLLVKLDLLHLLFDVLDVLFLLLRHLREPVDLFLEHHNLVLVLAGLNHALVVLGHQAVDDLFDLRHFDDLLRSQHLLLLKSDAAPVQFPVQQRDSLAIAFGFLGVSSALIGLKHVNVGPAFISFQFLELLELAVEEVGRLGITLPKLVAVVSLAPGVDPFLHIRLPLQVVSPSIGWPRVASLPDCGCPVEHGLEVHGLVIWVQVHLI